MTTKILDDSPIARGRRLKKIRQLAGLSAEELATKIGCSRQTVSYWENAAYGGLSYKGAQKVMTALRTASVYCDSGWLLYGIGNIGGWVGGTEVHNINISENISLLTHDTPFSLLREIALFRQLNKNAAILQLKEPIKTLADPDDWVGGCFEPINFELFDKVCLVELQGQLDIKLLRKSNAPQTVILSPISELMGQFNPAEEKEVFIERAARISRVWKQ